MQNRSSWHQNNWPTLSNMRNLNDLKGESDPFRDIQQYFYQTYDEFHPHSLSCVAWFTIWMMNQSILLLSPPSVFRDKRYCFFKVLFCGKWWLARCSFPMQIHGQNIVCRNYFSDAFTEWLLISFSQTFNRKKTSKKQMCKIKKCKSLC